MVLDSEDLEAISNALSESVSKKVNASMQLQFNEFKESLETSNRQQAENLDSTIKNRMDEVVVSLLKKQDDHEAKTDQRLTNFEKVLTTRQDNLEQKNEAKFLEVQKQILSLNQSMAEKASTTLKHPPLQSRQHP